MKLDDVRKTYIYNKVNQERKVNCITFNQIISENVLLPDKSNQTIKEKGLIV